MQYQHEKTVAQRLAAFATEIYAAEPTAEVQHAGKRCVVDWFAATLPGTVELPARSLEAGLADELGHGKAKTLSGHPCSTRAAALINGTASHTVEFDDIFAPAIYHPGSPTIAAALAVGQTIGADGSNFLKSVIAGYEVSTRIGKALGRAHYKYWHNTGTVGTFGAAIAAATLHDLGPDRTAHTLAIAATMAAGLQQAFRGDTQSKPLHAGHAADAGVTAAAMAAGGAKGALDMFEADNGLGAAMSDEVDWATALLDMGTVWNITRMTIKNHGCCGHIFPALDGVLHLQSQHGFSAEDIDYIKIGGYSATIDVTGNHISDTAPAAKFSLPFILASGLVHGSIRLDAYTPRRLGDPKVRALMPRITFHLDKDVDRRFPEQRSANVEIGLGDGRVFQHFQPHRVGDPDLPLSDGQLDAKFMELSASVLPLDRAEDLLARLRHLETLEHLEALCP